MVLIMKKTLTILSVSAWLMLGFFANTYAQQSKVRYADDQMNQRNYKHAVEMYQEAYANKPTYLTAKKTAEAFEALRDYDNIYHWWKTTVEYDQADQKDYVNFLNAAQLTGNLQAAKSLLEGKGVQTDGLGIQKLLELESRKKVKLENAAALNSSGSDFQVAGDGKGNLFFVSDRGEEFTEKMPGIRIDGRNRIFSEEKQDYTGRQYFSMYRKDKDGTITKVIPNVPDTYNFSDPSYAKEAGVLFYSVTRGIKKVRRKREIVVYPEIYYSKLSEDGTLEGFEGVPFNDSIVYSVMNPFVDEETKRLYFTSDMPGGMGGMDLYYVSYDSEMNFGQPVNLGAPINTAGNESHPFRKGDQFYFSSTGHPGAGGMDVFVADYSANQFSNVTNLGAPYNTKADDFGYKELLDTNGKPEVYISSNRKGGQGLDDIYSIHDLYKQFLARIIDCDGEIVTDGYLANLHDNTQGAKVDAQRTDYGSLRADLEPESDFSLTISKPGHFSIIDESITTKGFEGDTLKRTYTLTPIPYQLPVFVDIVYYDLDKYKIREDAKPALDKLAELMNRYSFLDLVVSSHTDSRASQEYNMKLSNNRAKAVTEYMAQYNIPADRIRLEWFGKEQLVNDCGDGVPCAASEHQLNRRSELILEAFSDVNKQYDMPESLKGKDFCSPEELFEDIRKEIAALPTIYFDFDKSMLRSVHKKELERTAILLNRLPTLQLYIEGHTDQRGSESYNESLSERRAESVKNYLIKRGIDANRMESAWFGKSQPVTDCSTGTCTEAMHQLNRRTELRLGKKK